LKKKILFFIPSLEGGGAERIFINLLRNLDYESFDVDVCVGVKKGIYLNEVPKTAKTKSLFPNSYFEKFAVFVNRYLNSRVIPKVVILFKFRDHYDTGISFVDSYYTDFMLAAGRRFKKKIAWIHASYSSYDNYRRYYKGRYKLRLINERYKKLDKIIFVSDDSRSEFQDLFGIFRNTEVVYNLMDVESIRCKSEKENADFRKNGVVNLIAVGSLLPVKAFHRLIYAAEKLKAGDLKFRIRILGNGPLLNDLEKLISDLRVEDQIEILGFIDNPYPIMKASDVFVMTSVSEALPTALCEAMILGLPCLVTDCSGCRELAGNGEFALMTGQSVNEISNGLKDLILDDSLREKYKTKSLERSSIFNDREIIEKIYSFL
jgi:glycosyltransferase involved in cell wall biosynthesis